MSRTVQAAVIDKKQSIVMREYPYPEVTADSGVLKVEATGIGGVDYEVYQGLGAGSVIPYPFIPGHVIVGRVDALGARAAERWGVKEGDRVVLNYTVACGECVNCRIGVRRRCLKLQGYGLWFDFDAPPYLWGGAAEYMALHPNSEMAIVPDDVDPSRACLQERLASAMNWLIVQGKLSMYDSLVVIGGTGMLGLTCIMMAKHAGAYPCIAVGRKQSTRLELARRMGADVVLSGEEDEVVAGVMAATGGRGADMVIELSDATAPQATALAVRCLARGGRALQVAVKDVAEISGLTASDLINREATLRGVYGHDQADLEMAMSLLRRGIPAAMNEVPIVEYSLDQAKEAMETPASASGASLTIIKP